jgi:transposase
MPVGSITLEQQQALKVELTTQIYSTAFQVIAWIETQWQVTYELSTVQKLLKRLGFTYKNNRYLPNKSGKTRTLSTTRLIGGVRLAG